jgi:hypothetical protein
MCAMISSQIVEDQIDRLNTQHDAMVKAAEEFTGALYKEDVFVNYSNFHQKHAKFTNSLIPITPTLPNQALPFMPEKKETNENNESILKDFKTGDSAITKIVLLVLVIPFVYLAYIRLVPVIVPIGFGLFVGCLLGAPFIVQLIEHFKQSEEEEDLEDLQLNPTEWISKELQIMSDKYDAIRGLIYGQEVALEKLPSTYSKMPRALSGREKQEMEFFPTECLNVVQKIMVFCNNSYYTQLDRLMGHLHEAHQAMTAQAMANPMVHQQ